jgi:PST family polysaccharide transporter
LKPILRGLFWVTAGDLFARLVGFVITAYVARMLAPDSFGVVSLGLAVLAYLGQISGAGLQVLEARNVAASVRVDAARVGAVISLRLALAVTIIALGGLGTELFVSRPETREALWVSMLILVPLAISLEWFFQGAEQFRTLSLAKIPYALAYGALVLPFVAGPEDVSAAILALGAATLSGAIFLFVVFHRHYGTLRFHIDIPLWKRLLAGGMPVGLAMLAAQSAVNLGPIVIGLLFSGADVGTYSAAMKLIVLILILDRVLNSLYLPMVSRVQAQRPEELIDVVNITMKVTFGLVLPGAVCSFILAPVLVPLVFGPGYDGAVDHFRILLGYVAFTLPNSVYACTLIGCGQERQYTKILTIGSLFLAGCVVVLAYVLGPAGAALGVAIGELATFGLLTAATKRLVSLDLTRPILQFGGALIAAAAFAVVFSDLPMIVSLIASVGIFFLVLTVVGGLRRHDLRWLRSRLA